MNKNKFKPIASKVHGQKDRHAQTKNLLLLQKDFLLFFD